jgi:hypothetical protein
MHYTRPTTQATIELQTDIQGDAPAGALLTSDGKRRRFSGWMELASAIEEWRQAQRHEDQTTGRRTMT